MCQELSRLTLDSIGVMAFGQHFCAVDDEGSENAIFEEVGLILREMQKRAIQIVPFYKYFPFSLLPSQKRFWLANEKIHAIVRRLIKERRQTATSSQRSKYLIDVLIEGQEGSTLPDAEIEDELITTIMGGHETTASLLSFLIYLLITHPHEHRMVMEELARVRHSRIPCTPANDQESCKSSIEWTFEDLQQMDYLHNVIKEGLRLYPSAPILNRKPIQDVTLGGFHIPANTEILISPWVLQRSPQYWDKPDEFLPQRWANGGKGSTNDNSLTFLAFSAGSRKCLGQQFAYMEAKLAIACIFSMYELRLVTSQQLLKTEMAITLRLQHGLWCELHQRP